MSDFYSRCLWCNLDLPRGLSFCTPTHREWWTRHHNREAVAVTLTDEVGNADVRERSERAKDAVSAGNRQDASPGVGDTRTTEGITDPTATLTREREERLANHDPKTCGHRHCGPMAF